MSQRQLRRDLVKIRKERVCFACREKQPVGSKMFFTVTIEDDKFYKLYMCPCCDSFLQENIDDFEEGIRLGEFRGEEVYNQFRKKYYEKILSSL